MIVSTGGGTMDDVRRAYDAIMPLNRQLAILQCTASYPTAFNELDLRVIPTYRDAFPDTVIGISAHDNGIAMALVAYVLGARIVEKHFTLNRAMKGTDHPFSLEPIGLKKLVRDLTRAREAMGDGIKKVYRSELPGITKMGKKLVAARFLPKGHVLTPGDVAIKSPGDGLPPYELPNVLGRVTLKSLAPDEPIRLDALGENGK
jgi:N-acetylneuraminate synthase/sialic acid synthase